MQFYRSFLIGLAIAATSLPTLPASAAVTPDCMVNALPRVTREQMIKAYAQGGPAMKKVLTTGVLVDTAERCIEYGEGNFDQLIVRAREILVAFAYQEGAAASLLARHNLARDTLERAWSGLTSVQRNRLGQLGKAEDPVIDAMITFVHLARPDISMATLEKMKEKNNLGSEFAPLVPLVTDLTAYAIGRALIEARGS